MQIEKLNSS